MTLPRPYHVFLSSRVQIPNAATTPYGYLFLLLNPPRYPTLFGNTTGWLDVTIRHELMHAMTFAGSRRPFDRFGLSFGLAVPRVSLKAWRSSMPASHGRPSAVNGT